LILEPVRSETAGRVLQVLASRTMTSKPNERSWDFDGCESTSARNGTCRSPMQTHETSPISGASVVGMTIRVGQGKSHLPADRDNGNIRPRRAASTEGPAAPAAGWRLHHRRTEPAKTTKTLQWTLYQKERGPDKIDRYRRPA
jgi:hypothetical protein